MEVIQNLQSGIYVLTKDTWIKQSPDSKAKNYKKFVSGTQCTIKAGVMISNGVRFQQISICNVSGWIPNYSLTPIKSLGVSPFRGGIPILTQWRHNWVENGIIRQLQWAWDLSFLKAGKLFVKDLTLIAPTDCTVKYIRYENQKDRTPNGDGLVELQDSEGYILSFLHIRPRNWPSMRMGMKIKAGFHFGDVSQHPINTTEGAVIVHFFVLDKYFKVVDNNWYMNHIGITNWFSDPYHLIKGM